MHMRLDLRCLAEHSGIRASCFSLAMLNIYFYICEKISSYVLFRNGSTFNADETNILDYMQENPQILLFIFEFVLYYVCI